MSEQPVYYDIYNNGDIDLCFSPNVIEFQAEVREILKSYNVPVFCGDFSKGYDFIASIKEIGKDKLKLIKALENSTTHWIGKWYAVTEKLKDRDKLIGVTKLYTKERHVDDFKKRFQTQEWMPGNRNLVVNWERDEIYNFDYIKTVKRFSRPSMESGELGHCTGIITAQAQSDITKALKKKFELGEFDKSNGYDKLIYTIKGFVLIENKIGNKRTWESGPPSLLLSNWLQLIHKVFHYAEQEGFKVFKVIGVVPDKEEENIWEHPTTDKDINGEHKIVMMTMDKFKRFIADPKLKQGEPERLDDWKNRVILKMKKVLEKVLTKKEISEHGKAFITITKTGARTLKKLSKNPVNLLRSEYDLKKMEINVLREICNKKSDNEILEILNIESDALNTHKNNVYEKLTIEGVLSGKKEDLIACVIDYLGTDLYSQFIKQTSMPLHKDSLARIYKVDLKS